MIERPIYDLRAIVDNLLIVNICGGFIVAYRWADLFLDTQVAFVAPGMLSEAQRVFVLLLIINHNCFGSTV